MTLWLHIDAPPSVGGFIARLDNIVYDQRYNLFLPSRGEGEHKIVIVDYDQKSLDAEGQWPWSRFKIGDMVENLADAGALVIGFDVTFPEPARNLVLELEERLGSESRALINDLERVQEAMDADAYFADKLQSTDVALGMSFRANDALRYGTLPEKITEIDAGNAGFSTLITMQGYEANIAILQDAALGGGFFDTIPDIDGIIRSTPLVLNFQNQLYPSLALEMARLYYFEENFTIETEDDTFGTFRRVTGINMGQITIPTTLDGRVLIPYIGRSELGQGGIFPYISATDILQDSLSDVERGQLENSLVLVGTTATGLFDLRATPLEAVYPGVEVHANVLNALLNVSPMVIIDESDSNNNAGLSNVFDGFNFTQNNPFPARPDWENGAIAVAIFMIGLFLSLIYPRLGPALLSLSSLAFMLGLVALNFKLWIDYKLDISLVILLFLILLITVINMTYGFLKEGMNRRAIKMMFDQYVPPAHIDAMLDDPDNYNFEGESKELSVLFSDIRGFTSISEGLSASELKTFLNDFFTPITGIIFDNNGTIDKYVGDMVMAFWGAPLDDPDHRRNSVLAGLEMLEKTEELKAQFVARGLPEVNVGIGINSGLMNVGDMGSTYRRSYTVLGDAVNLGSRMESITKFYGVKFLIGEATYDHIEGFLCRLIDKVQVKGKEQPVRIYEPLCLEKDASVALLDLVRDYQTAYDFYLQQKWDEAEACFKALEEKESNKLLYSVYLERIENLRNQDFPEGWDGTFRHTTK
ncbi:adenylate/guanylate cyclase domain-containing protein [Gammaproteobacteria bacterium AH-315-E17]|nr:adenylate/guanylate cyclase domain-containing protein [Gammaproteobacteria bacterium AH-315-E17]